MNQRIKELAEQAGFSFKYKTAPNELNPGHTRQDLEKFAELIISECAQFIDDESIRLIEYQESLPEWDGNKRDDCDLVIEKCYDLSARLKQYFGVE